MSYLPSLPEGSLLDAFRAYAELAAPIHEFAHALMRGPSPFSQGERELIAAYVSNLNGCEYCRSSHSAVAERFGMDSGLVDALLDDLESAGASERMKPVLRYVRKLNDAPRQVHKADVDAVLAAGWDERAVVHAALVCAHFNLMNRWVEGLGIEADPKMVQIASKHLHEHGYRAIAELVDRTREAGGG